MDMKFNVVYEIKEREGWRGKEGLQIKSNIADDKLVECDIATSLVEHLKKESAIFDPDKLLLGLAEAQKRQIEDNLQVMDDMSLRAKNAADKVQEEIMKSYEENERKYEELEKKFSETQERFSKKIDSTIEAIKESMQEVEDISKRLSEVNNFELSRLSDSLTKIIELVEKDSEIVKLVLNAKQSN